ncbi:MAG TPA: peptidylprolyl isomerase [Saprospirales bacterium]|nr:peptidylprolyl isomerase [Saprospirales bacterium]
MQKNLFKLIFLLSLLFYTSCKEHIFKVEIQTVHGNMVFELYNSTPLHRDSFIKLIDSGFYDELLFHRVIHDFMVQGGDPDSKNAGPEIRLGSGGPGYLIPAEIGALHVRGALAAARIGGKANPDKFSSGSQFYIVQGLKKLNELDLEEAVRQHNRSYTEDEKRIYLEQGGYPALDNEYTVFGKLVQGFDVLDKIATVETDSDDRPLQNLPMKVRVIR